MKLAIAAAVCLTTLSAVPAFAGPQSGGGGNVCEVPGTFYGTRLQALDTVGSSTASHSIRLSLLSSDRIQFDQRDQKTGLKVISPKPSLIQGTDLILRDLRAQGPAGINAADEISRSVRDLQIAMVPSLPTSRPIGADFTGLSKCSPTNTHAAILYDWQIGIVVSQSIWNRLSAYDQVTLLIHEALRNVQIRYRFGFSNGVLQNLTGDLMSGNVANFLRSYSAFRAQAPKASQDSLARLCTAKNLKISYDLTAFSLNQGQSNAQFDYFANACKTHSAENLWKLFDHTQKDDSLVMGMGWDSWGITEAELVNYREAVTGAYLSTTKSNSSPADVWYSSVVQRGALRFIPITMDQGSADQAKFLGRLANVAKTLAQ